MEHEDAPLRWLEQSWLGAVARDSLFLYPLAGVAHIFGIALLLGAILAFDLRVLGAAPRIPLAPAARLLLTLARTGFGLLLASGLVMLAADASHLIGNPAFLMKLGLILCALLNVLAFHLFALPDPEVRPGAGARLSAALSMALWLGVATSGRLIAYF
jgi:hypothetical protein